MDEILKGVCGNHAYHAKAGNMEELVYMNKMQMSARIAAICLLSLLLLLTAVLAWGCRKAEPSESEEDKVVEEETAGEETVTLTLYFRKSTQDVPRLAPERRTVEGVTDAYRSAMEELIAGPSPDSGLDPVLPDTVRVLGIEERQGILTVDVSIEILTDAPKVGVSATTEGLALAAIANTLTEFDGVDKVRLLIEGTQSGEVRGRHVEDFWGHVGLPEYLERNEEAIYKGQEAGQGGGDATEWRGGIAFGTSPQKVGGAADGLKVASLRFYDHGSYFRVVFDIARQDGTVAPDCPATRAEWLAAAGGVKVSIGGILEVSNQAASGRETGDSLVPSIGFTGINAGRAEYIAALSREAPFFLHYMANPMRIILDLEKSPGAQPDI